MKVLTRTLVVLASLLVIAGLFFPLWHIQLLAPEYPEGLDMYIWASHLSGGTPYDIENINVLNHYIGMQDIQENSIPELHVMPYVLWAIALLGLLAAITKKRIFLCVWLGTFVLFAVAGLVDFYKWEYNYGHNLDPASAIVIPGMVYQPPLIGSKQLLNFVATSLPASGGLLLVSALGIGFVALLYDYYLWEKA
jgi:copper chaperone NosL